MKLLQHVLAVAVGLRFASAYFVADEADPGYESLGLSERADFDFGSDNIFRDSDPEAFLEAIQGIDKSEAKPTLHDRSAELYKRQRQCQSGYGYCASLGGCCPSDNRCCPYGYCLEPGQECCPNGPCAAGSTCCGNRCMPKGAKCCLGDKYCEAGNMCVLYDGREVCCTDLKCTAVIQGGTTSFARTTTVATPTITQPPRTTQVIADSFTTYYWTVRWRYWSYYWTIFQAQSTVTYTTITITTIYTTTATDASAASAIFAELSRTLTFSTPAEATTLASLLGVAPSPTATPTTALSTVSSSSQAAAAPTSQEIDLSPPGDDETSSSSSARGTTTSSSRAGSSTSPPPTLSSGGSAAGSLAVQMIVFVTAVLSGILMIWL